MPVDKVKDVDEENKNNIKDDITVEMIEHAALHGKEISKLQIVGLIDDLLYL